MKKICLTFDVESFDVHGRWQKGHMRLDGDYTREGLGPILKLLRQYNVKCTFFITGEFYLQQRNLVLRMQKEGHEIACHGFSHVPYNQLSVVEARQDMLSATRLLCRDMRILGFRAPQNIPFPGMYRDLRRLGYVYSSSTHYAFIPGKMKKGMISEGAKKIFGIWEIPASTFLGMGLSWLWFRMIGLWWVRLFLSLRFLFRDYAVLYLHPWEFVDLSHFKRVPNMISLRTGDPMISKLASFLQRSCIQKREFVLMRDLAKDL